MAEGADQTEGATASPKGRLALAYLASVVVTVSLLPLVGAAMDALVPADAAPGGLALYYGVAILSAGFAYGLAAVCGLLPALLWIAASERHQLRYPLAHTLAGAVWAAAGWLLFSIVTDALADPLLGRVAADLFIAGAFGGLAYWAVAGRRAGLGRPPATPGAQQSFDSTGGSR
ncbi:hypothetical protein ABLE93_16430 [Xanthobacter sp. KR7-65]|uniref:hypothetical protein n=1 Tax=Xanthobacter sp. KR7-65 TaxID=3156612 RepID=UPI0032B5CB62